MIGLACLDQGKGTDPEAATNLYGRDAEGDLGGGGGGQGV